MSADDVVREAAEALAKSGAAIDERRLLEALGARMKTEASSFDPEHDLARIVAATDQWGEVRLTTDGAWKLGSAPEQDLLAAWKVGAHPPLARILEGVQESFSSAHVSALVGEIKTTLGASLSGSVTRAR